MSLGIEAGHRLAVVMQKVGQALWYVQAFENVAGTYVVVSLRQAKGVGRKAGEEIARKVERIPLGPILHELMDAKLVDDALSQRMLALLGHRNWLVHHMWRESHGVLASHARLVELYARLDRITEEAQALHKLVGREVENYVVRSGVDRGFIDDEAERLARSWGLME